MKANIIAKRTVLEILGFVVIVTVILAATSVSKSKVLPEANITLSGVELSVVVANTPTLYEKGLSGHPGLGENEGMLFVFPAPLRTGFWMKDMLFPIDIIWFDTDQKIVDMWENATPSSYPEIRAPQKDAQYVLEVPAGFVHAHNVWIGDQFKLAQ